MINQIGRDPDPDPRKVTAERLTDHDPPSQRIAEYDCGCQFPLSPSEQPSDTCPKPGCSGELEGVVIADGGRIVEDDHDCIAATDQLSDLERCRLCGRVIDE